VSYDEKFMAPDCCYTLPFNAMGSPAISLPLGMSREGWPIGVQFIGRDCDEAGLLRLAAQLEVARPWAQRRPGA
jgi:amidase